MIGKGCGTQKENSEALNVEDQEQSGYGLR